MKINRKKPIIIVRILLILAFFLSGKSDLLSQTTVEVNPVNKITAINRTFSIQVVINNVTDLQASTVTLGYDSSLIKVLSVQNGGFIPGFFATNLTAGNSVRVDQANIGTPTSTGSGTLFIINYQAKQSGVSPLNLNVILLRTSNNDPIPYSLVSGSVTILGTPDEVWVNQDYSDGAINDGHIWDYDAFDALTNGVNGVNPNGIVHIAPGTYNENITIGKNLLITTEEQPVVRSFTLINGAVVNLQGEIFFSHALTFTNGKMYTDTSTVELGSTAVITESSGNYLIGLLKMTRFVGTGSFSFGGMGLILGSGTNNLANVTVTRISGSQGHVTIGGEESLNRRWIITSTNPPTAGRNITFSWLPDDDNTVVIPGNVTLYKSTDGGSIWIAAGPEQTLSSRSFSTNITSFSEWTLSKIGAPDTVYVDLNYTFGSAGGHTYGYDAFNKLSEAIAAVKSGGTIVLYNGNYNEVVSLSKPVNLIGVGEPQINSLTVTGGVNINLKGNILIQQSLKLTSGKITTGTGDTLKMGTDCTINESTGNYVVGNLMCSRYVGSTGSDFGGMGVNIGGAPNTLGNVSVLRVSGPAGNVDSEGINRKWIIRSETVPPTPRDISFSWISDDDNGTTLGLNRVFKSNNDGVSWRTVTTNTPVTREITSFGQFNYAYSIWTIGHSDAFGSSPTLNLTAEVTVNAKVLLEGPYVNGVMERTLNISGLLPFSQPYSGAPWNYKGTENVESNFFTTNSTTVDWVVVDLRSSTDSSVTVARRVGVLKSDGIITEVDGGNGPLGFKDIPAGDYYIVVRHRNHIAIMSANPITLNRTSALYDFSDSQAKAFGINPMKQLGTNAFGLIRGDVNTDGQVNASDRSLTWNTRNTVGYLKIDINLDGQVNATDRAGVWNNRNFYTQVP